MVERSMNFDQELTWEGKVRDLVAFRFLQDLYASAQGIGVVESIREHLSNLV